MVMCLTNIWRTAAVRAPQRCGASEPCMHMRRDILLFPFPTPGTPTFWRLPAATRTCCSPAPTTVHLIRQTCEYSPKHKPRGPWRPRLQPYTVPAQGPLRLTREPSSPSARHLAFSSSGRSRHISPTFFMYSPCSRSGLPAFSFCTHPSRQPVSTLARLPRPHVHTCERGKERGREEGGARLEHGTDEEIVGGEGALHPYVPTSAPGTHNTQHTAPRSIISQLGTTRC